MSRVTRARRFGTSITTGHGTGRGEPTPSGRQVPGRLEDEDEGAASAVSDPTISTGGGPGATVVGGAQQQPPADSARPADSSRPQSPQPQSQSPQGTRPLENPQPSASPASPEGPENPRGRGPVAHVTEFVYKLASSTLATPRAAVAISLTGLLLVMLVGIVSPNYNTLPRVTQGDHKFVAIVLPLSGHIGHLPSSASITLTFTAIILQCIGLAGLLWANSRGWRPNPRHLFLAAAVIVGIMVCITPVGSSDTTSYAAYGRMANLGIDPYSNGPNALGPSDLYYQTVGPMWGSTPSVYGPLATWLQQFAALFGGKSNPAAAVDVLMILNGAVFLGVGYFLLKTADDPVRATLMWVANPVLIQQLVMGGHLDTYVAAATVVGVQLARSRTSGWRYLWVGLAIGLGCCFKINAGLAGVAVGWVLLTRREWVNLAGSRSAGSARSCSSTPSSACTPSNRCSRPRAWWPRPRPGAPSSSASNGSSTSSARNPPGRRCPPTSSRSPGRS
jgi:hypothetical protein